MQVIEETKDIINKIVANQTQTEEFKSKIEAFCAMLFSENSELDRERVHNALERAYYAKEFATKFSARKFPIDTNTKEVLKLNESVNNFCFYNDIFQPQLNYTQSDIVAIKEQLRKVDLYRFESLDNGLIRTSETINEHMRWQWFTDTCMIGAWQKKINREEWQKALLTSLGIIASTKNTEITEKITWNPEKYRFELFLGIYHVFNPKNIHYDENGIPAPDSYIESNWFYPKRVESHGLMLLNLIEEIIFELENDNPKSKFNFKNEHSNSLIRKVLHNLARYILSINFNRELGDFDMQAPTNSSWEEVVFEEGGSFDAAVCILSIERLRDLLLKTYNNQELKEFLFDESEEYNLEGTPHYANYLNLENLDKAISNGKDLINKWVVNSAKENNKASQNPIRGADTTIFLLSATDYIFDNDPLKNVELSNIVLKANISQLAGETGFRRYNEFKFLEHHCFDSYLNLDYQLFTEVPDLARIISNKKSSDKHVIESFIHELRDFIDRQELGLFKYTAEWTIGTTAALQAASKNLRILKNIHSDSKDYKNIYDESKLIFNYCLNLCLAQICGDSEKQITRADGTNLPHKYCIVEAFQAITDLENNVKWLPGQHTLAWSQAQLLDALDIATEAL